MLNSNKQLDVTERQSLDISTMIYITLLALVEIHKSAQGQLPYKSDP